MNFNSVTKLLAALAVFSASLLALDQDNDDAMRDENAKQVAKAWFVSLMQGETSVTTALSSVPFNFDGKKQIETHPDLKQIFDQVVAKKGKRNLKPRITKIKFSAPDKVEVALLVADDDEEINIVVKPNEAYRVAGFTD